MKIRRHQKRTYATTLLIVVFLMVAATAGVWYQKRRNTPVIETATFGNITASGTVSDEHGNRSTSSTEKLQAPASKKVTYTSMPKQITKSANAAVLSWDQDGNNGIILEVRTRNAKKWSNWSKISATDGGKDSPAAATGSASAIVLASKIDEFQFRVILQGSVDDPSSTISLANSKLETIDSTRGPSASPSLFDKVIGAIAPQKALALRSDGPQVIGRSQWGSPEASYSPGWTPEYTRLSRAIIHHTATTESSDSYADVRAIWQYHSRTLGWGDIGYNYIVDSRGRVFEGRYYDHSYANNNNVDVIGGHAYDNNVGTTGISIIGNYDEQQPTTESLNSAAEIVGYKLATYGVDPRSSGPNGQAVIGHFQVYSTSCPGLNVRSRLDDIRNTASAPYEHYKSTSELDYSHVIQRMYKGGIEIPQSNTIKPGDSIELEIGLRNTGSLVWDNGGTSPVYLGTDSPQDRQSQLYDKSWVSQNRLATFRSRYDESTKQNVAANSIKPNEVAIFKFKVTVPKFIQPGNNGIISLVEYLKPVRENYAWFKRSGMYPPLNIQRAYAWQWVSQGVYTDSSMTKAVTGSLQAGNKYYFTMKAKNTGASPWIKNGDSPTLGTSNPLDRQSQFYDSTWISKNRAARQFEDVVEPGNVGTFGFWVQVPTTSQDFSTREYFRPVMDGIGWLDDYGAYWDIKVTGARYSWRWQSQALYTDESLTTVAPATLSPGIRYYTVINFTNQGTTSLSKNSVSPTLGTSNPLDRQSQFYDSTWISKNRAARQFEDVVEPGKNGSFRFWITAPTTANQLSSKEYFRPVIDGVQWLEDYGVYLSLLVKPTAYDWTPTSTAIYTDSSLSASAPSTLQPNTRYYLVLKAKNTGTTTWDKRIVLGTWGPQDRLSVYKDTSWINSNRTTSFAENSVPPGATGTFGFWVRTPQNPSDGSESFNIVTEGVQWLPDRNLFWKFSY